MKAIVTGPTGGIGVALIDELLKNHYEVTAVVRPGSKRLGQLPEGVKVVQLDLHEIGKLTELLSGTYDAFFHLGWNGTYGDSRMDEKIQQENVDFTMEALRAAHALHCSVFVGSGSQAEFGHVDGVLCPDTPCNPETAYGKAKYRAGEESRVIAKTLGIRHIWMRILSAYGPGDAPYTMVMGTLLAFLRHEPRSFTKGDQVWDYIYTKDLARAFRLAAEKGKDGAVYVPGSGKTKKLRAYIEVMRDLTDPEREITFGELPYYPNQVMHLEADISALTADTGFVPEYDFREGILETIRRIKAQD